MQKSYYLLKIIPFLFLTLLPISGQTSEATDVWCESFGVQCPDVSSPDKLKEAISGGFAKMSESSLASESNPLNEQNNTDISDTASEDLPDEEDTTDIEETHTEEIEESETVSQNDDLADDETDSDRDEPVTDLSEGSESDNDDDSQVQDEDLTDNDIQSVEDTDSNQENSADDSNVATNEDIVPTENDNSISDDNTTQNVSLPKTVNINSTDESDLLPIEMTVNENSNNTPTPNPSIVERDNSPKVVDESGTPTTIQVSLPKIECPFEPELEEKSFTLLIGDKPITQKFLGKQQRSEFIQTPNGEIVTLLESEFEPNGEASVTFEPREAGETQFIIGNCFQQTVVTIEVFEPVIETCQTDFAFPLKPEQPHIAMHKGETRTLWFTGGQTKRWLSTLPASDIIMLDSSEFPEEGGAKLTLIASQAGTTQLAISDCGETTVVDITVIDKEPICSVSPLKPNKQDITLVLGELAITPTFIGDEVNLTAPPDDAIVILDLPIYSEADVTQLKLTPRQVGKTQLMLSNCAGDAIVNLTVIKPNSLAYFCWLAETTTDICHNPNYKQALIFDSFGFDAGGKSIEANGYFESFIKTGYDSVKDNVIIGQTDKATAHFNIIVDESHFGMEADLILYAERQANNGKPNQFFMYNGKTWQEWDSDISHLIAAKHYDDMPLITELSAKLDSLVQYNTSGEYTLTVGYRLNNGYTILSETTVRFWASNSSAYPSPIKTRAYFAGNIQWHDRSHRTQQNVTITIRTKPDKQDIGKKADIIIVAQVSIDEEMHWFMQMPDKTWTNWDGNINHLATIGNKVLVNNMKTEISGDVTNIMGNVTIYIGYRMSDNQIIFNGREPLVVRVP